MKIRSSLRMPLLVAPPLGVVCVLPLPLVEPDASYAEPEFWYLAAASSGVVLLIGLIVVCFPGMNLDGDRFLVRGRYGWSIQKALEEGERWVISGNQLCLQRRDGSLAKLHAPKWAVNRRDWQRLEAALPVLDTL